MVRPVLRRLFIANRGEIAVRIARTALDLDIAAIMTAPEDDAASLHMRMGEAVLLPGRGGAAYLDVEAIIAAARSAGCDAVHPGYGFLSESAAFAEACARAGLTFVGPAPETLAVFGDKARAREVAATAGAALLDGIARAVDVSEARSFLEDLGEGGAVMLKAVAGGGGRGIRRVDHPDDLAEASAPWALHLPRV